MNSNIPDYDQLAVTRDLLRFTRTHLRHHEALMQATGGHFNLYQILGIGHYEVKTHSPMLAELLSPKGRHGQGDLFLKLFLQRFELEEWAFLTKTARVTVEYHIGTKTENTGGRIDIMVEDVIGQRILIENKIYAGDQENQLLRYHNFDPNARLIYLTLSGSDASEYSAKGLMSADYHKFSYEIDIRDWLIACRKEATCLPRIRETLTQYIDLIEELTHQSTTNEMNQDLIEEIIKTPENLTAFHAMREAEAAVRTQLIVQLDADLKLYAKSIGLEGSSSIDGLHLKDKGFSFVNESLRKNNLKICFEFEKNDYGNFAYGFAKIDHTLSCWIEDRIQAAYQEVFKLESYNEFWPAWSYFEDPYRYWSNQAFEHILTGELAKNIGFKLLKLSEIANQVCEEVRADHSSRGDSATDCETPPRS